MNITCTNFPYRLTDNAVTNTETGESVHVSKAKFESVFGSVSAIAHMHENQFAKKCAALLAGDV